MSGFSCGRTNTDAATLPKKETTLATVCRRVAVVDVVGSMGLVAVVGMVGGGVTPEKAWVDGVWVETRKMVVVRVIGKKRDRFMVWKILSGVVGVCLL